MDRLSKTAKKYDIKINVKDTKNMVVLKKGGEKINIKSGWKEISTGCKILSILERYCLRMEGA